MFYSLAKVKRWDEISFAETLLTVLGIPSCWKLLSNLHAAFYWMSSYILNICRRRQVNGLLKDWGILLLVLSLGSIFNSLPAWSNLHSCFPLPRRAPSLSGYSAFLGGICQTLLLNLTQLSQENPTFWLIHGGFATCIKQVKTALQWKTRVSFSPPLPCCTLPAPSLYFD